MATNDYRSYMRATEEYRHSDTLQHAGKKGMKWGISHTPGYKAIGQKAKGIINSLGNYVYNTYNKLTSKSTPTATLGTTTAAKVATKDPAKEARDEIFRERSERLKNPAPPKTPEPKKEEDKPEPEQKTESHAEVVGKIDAKEGPKEPQKDDLKEDEHGKYRIVDGEKHYDLGDGKEYLYADGTFFEVGGTGKTVPEGKTPEPAKPGEREPSDRMVDDDGNLKLLDQYGPYFDVNGEKHYDIEGKDYYYSDGLYFPVDGSGEALALVWNDEKFCFEPAEDVRHSETSPRYIGEILDTEDDLAHWGILGMKWGIRRYQNKDGSLTPEGRARYLKGGQLGGRLNEEGKQKLAKSFSKEYKKHVDNLEWTELNSLVKNSEFAKEIGRESDDELDELLSADPEKKKLLKDFNEAFDKNVEEYSAIAAVLQMKEDIKQYPNRNTMEELAFMAGWYRYDDGDQGENNSRAVCAYMNGFDPLKVEEAGSFARDCVDEVEESIKKKYSDVDERAINRSLNTHSKNMDIAYTSYEVSERITDKKAIPKAQALAKKIAYCFHGKYWTRDVENALNALGFSKKSPDDMTDADWAALNSYIDDHSTEVQQMDSDQNELYHEGRGHLDGGRSGRYPWGSGADPYQRSELGSARAAAEGILKRAGDMPADKFLNNGILDVSTVANNAIDNGRPLTSKNNQMNAAAGAAYSLAANPTWENAAKVVPKAIVDSGTRGWTEHDFDGIPTEIIKQSNERSAAIKAYKGFHGESTPVSDGAAKAAKVASLGLTAIAFIKLVEGLKGKSGSP